VKQHGFPAAQCTAVDAWKTLSSTSGAKEQIVNHRGISHIGLSTLDLDKTRAFYEDVLGFKPVVADTITVEEGGRLRHLFFDIGGGQLIAFLEPRGVPGIPAKYDAGINRGLGVPAGFYHFAFEAGSPAGLARKRDELRAMGVVVTEIVDHQWAQSIYFKDPNGLSLEYCCVVGERPQAGKTAEGAFTIRRAALDLGDALAADIAKAKPAHMRQR
jgi:catechol 2,3-dioxygenase-like lactoylglutathione lyase family enzyme